MNSLNYLSRQIDVLATAGTPPSTPLTSSHIINTGRPQRAKSYNRIVPRRPSHHGQQHADGSPAFPTHANKRSFSSPALWSFRKPSLTPNSSSPPTPAPVLKRTTSYDFGLTPTPESTSPHTRPLLIRIITIIWSTLCALWFGVTGYLVLPPLLPRQGATLESEKNTADDDTTGDEGQESEDDGIVARATKRSILTLEQDKEAETFGAPLASFQMSITSTTIQEEEPPFSLEPPTPEEVQARTETPRIDLIPPTPRTHTPPPSIRQRPTPSSSLLPNPIASSLLTRANTVPSSAQSSTTLQQQQQPHPQQYQPSPRKMTGLHMQKTLVLDLDETLIHSTSRPLRAHTGGGVFSMGGFGFGFGEKRGREAGHMVEVVLGDRCTLYHVYKRPFVDYFLRKVSSWYTLVIFTASMQEYADPVIDWLDAGRGILSRRFFRESCTQLPNGGYTKDLSLIEEDLSRVCLIDNSPVSYNINPANGIPIEGWISDPSDEALLHLLPVLDSLRFASDVRRILGLRLFN
ncbi:related to nuclear envelope protein NEM1 [Serendipita indica DSM 11827]|uniref:Related to nuclear envelope protein NEM1 n=1 Tax=Serendipita indica (strain DSM 11827) TaxID=1109443 RepID=G4TKE6_SERID|nr:related to nuclear envelope protein NEM1 [Serendipita indica DSM 11827]